MNKIINKYSNGVLEIHSVKMPPLYIKYDMKFHDKVKVVDWCWDRGKGKPYAMSVDLASLFGYSNPRVYFGKYIAYLSSGSAKAFMHPKYTDGICDIFDYRLGANNVLMD